MLYSLLRFFNEKLWMIRSKDVPPYLRLLLSCARILVLTIRRFIQNECSIKAASLTFYSLFSVVPILALVFGVAQGLGFARNLEGNIRELMSSYPEVAEKIIFFADTLLQKTRGGIVAGFGVILLLWSAIKLLSNIENTLNNIWGVKRGRSFMRRLADYVTILILCPVLLLTAGGGIVFTATRASGLTERLPFSEIFNTLLQFGTGLLPLGVTCIVFTFIYIVIPNTKVRFFSALPAGFLTAIAYTALQSVYIFAQYTTTQLNAIYGSFAALPLFLIWLNLSWILILAGAQLSFSIQNVSEYEMEPVDGSLSQTQKYIYCLEILASITRSFAECRGPLSDEQISLSLEIPIRTVRNRLFEMVTAGILTEVMSEDSVGTHYYQVAVPLERITPAFVIRSLEEVGGKRVQTRKDARYATLLESLRHQLEQHQGSRPLVELALEKAPEKKESPK